MAQLTVRKVPDQIVKALRIRAAKNGRSAEAEHRHILESTLHPAADEFWERADRLRASLPPQRSDSAAILRELRDER